MREWSPSEARESGGGCFGGFRCISLSFAFGRKARCHGRKPVELHFNAALGELVLRHFQAIRRIEMTKKRPAIHHVVSSLSGFRKLGCEGDRIISIAAMGRKILANFDQERKISSRAKSKTREIIAKTTENNNKGTPIYSPTTIELQPG